MMKKRCLIVMGYMTYGGVQKSLVDFLDAIKEQADVDVLLWGRAKEEIPLPAWVNIVSVPTVKSVRAAMRENGIFSRSFLLSCLGFLRKKRWKAMPRLKKRYDIAIAYPQVGFPKYYVIDRVKADKKYAFYHHGAYEFSGKIKEWDKEYYPQYDKVYCVSKHVQAILENALNADIKYDVMPCGINVDLILRKGDECCMEMQNSEGIKILTVGRLAPEKNIERCLEIAERLKSVGVKFTWMILGEGDLRHQLQQAIYEKGLNESVFLLGNKENPYKYMKNCDVYAQFSLYEADPITVKEAAVFNKPMVLSNITAFQNTQRLANNVFLCDSVEDAVKAISNIPSCEARDNDRASLNDVFLKKVDELFA